MAESSGEEDSGKLINLNIKSVKETFAIQCKEKATIAEVPPC